MYRPNLFALTAVLTLATPSAALACGGFFCDAVFDPVVQTAERVLFRVNPDDTITSVIEIQFEGEPTDFAWVLPLSEAIDPESVRTAPAGIFDALDQLTAPRFVTFSATGDSQASAAGLHGGCSGFGYGGMGVEGDFVPPDTSGVEVVGNSVVGPYAIEVITADNPANLLTWLQINGYQTPASAQQPIAAYVSSGGAFLGVKLNPSASSGPIDALEITFPGTEPSLPLLLTAVAAVDNMDITAYVLATERYSPANYVEHAFDWNQVQWTGEGRTDYESRLPAEVDSRGGRAFVTEFAGATQWLPLVDGGGSRLSGTPPTPMQAASSLLRTGDYISRFRTLISANEMTEDPVWLPAPEQADVANEHAIGANGAATAGFPLWAFGLLVLGVSRRWVFGCK